jgi:hypothetical protein
MRDRTPAGEMIARSGSSTGSRLARIRLKSAGGKAASRRLRDCGEAMFVRGDMRAQAPKGARAHRSQLRVPRVYEG